VAQSITGTTTFQNLALNNASGLTLNNAVTASGVLTLTSGAIATGANILTTTASCPASVSRTSGFVNGNLRLTFPSGTTTCTFPLGSNGNYSPIAINLVTTLLGGGTLTGSTVGNEHPAIANSGIDSSLDVNRYWSLWASGDTVDVGSYGVTFGFVSGELDALATPGNFVIGKYVAGAWTRPTPVTPAANSTGVSNVSGPITAATGFVAGEPVFDCFVPAGSPAGVTCVCDNFNRTNLNPSTIYAGNWVVNSSSGTFGLPRIVANRLRLTDNTTAVATVAAAPGTFPASSNWISVEFKHYAYGGTGADGMAFILSDAAIPVVPGAFGGSLGYAQKSNPGSDCTTVGGCPGFAGGWVGVAIDEYGNFSANTEGRTGGAAPGQIVDSISARGSGRDWLVSWRHGHADANY
jgi:MSHA biogenesis protein MshQ